MPYTRRRNGYKFGTQRPQSQGANPYADFGCLEALRLTGQYIVRAVNDATDFEAREQMMLAAVIAGTSMGNVGVHLPHGMSVCSCMQFLIFWQYSVSGLIRDFRMAGYPQEDPLVPHGVSVILNAPSVFRWTCSSNPQRHLKCAEALGATIKEATNADAGEILYKELIKLMQATHMPSGLQQLGYNENDIPLLVKGTMPQARVVNNAPLDVTENDLSNLFKGAMKYY